MSVTVPVAPSDVLGASISVDHPSLSPTHRASLDYRIDLGGSEANGWPDYVTDLLAHTRVNDAVSLGQHVAMTIAHDEDAMQLVRDAPNSGGMSAAPAPKGGPVSKTMLKLRGNRTYLIEPTTYHYSGHEIDRLDQKIREYGTKQMPGGGGGAPTRRAVDLEAPEGED